MRGKRFKWCFLLFFVLAIGILSASFNGTTQGSGDPNQGRLKGDALVFLTNLKDIKPMERMMQRAIAAGNLRLADTQVENLGEYVHQRYNVYYKGIPVWAAQLIRHLKNGAVYCINGDFFQDINIPVEPILNRDRAVAIAKNALFGTADELRGEASLVIYPSKEGYRLVYKVDLQGAIDQYWFAFVDAGTGELIFKYNNIQTSETGTFGVGQGILGDWKKLSVDLVDGTTYYLVDLMRPAKLITANSNYSENTSSASYFTSTDNTKWSDRAAVDAHGYLGWIWDYYYLVHNRKGMNDANMQQVITVHLGKNYQNAFYMFSTKWMYFGDGDPKSRYPYPAALDIICHEFSHGVTHHTSNLVYAYDSGALNEAFSDIMGVSCEFFFQPAGYGYQKAEWWEGEDTNKNFGPSRDLSNPHSQKIWQNADYRYPDHLSEKLIMDDDNGGVHINMTIATHWYYLLANGGTNRKSRITVNGIGVGDAEKIAYRGWTRYLGPNATFKSARSATYQAAVDIFGGSSAQAQRVALAWDAVGVY